MHHGDEKGKRPGQGSRISWVHPSEEGISGFRRDYTGSTMYLFLICDFLDGMHLNLIHLIQTGIEKNPDKGRTLETCVAI